MLEKTGETKALERDSYGKVNCINFPYMNTGSVSQVNCKESNNPELDNSLRETSDFLDEMFEKYNVKKKLATKSF